MNQEKAKQAQRKRRKARSRAKVTGVKERPRLSVFRSNRHMYAQLIDDESEKTLVSASSSGVKGKNKKSDDAALVGEAIAEKAVKAGINKASLHKGSYKYHGRVKALVEAARKKGLRI